MHASAQMTILGGGPGGLAIGYYARKRGIPCTVYEATGRLGGNCVTLRHGEFLFDSGAHRLHDQDAEATAEIKALLGDDLRQINVPSLIYSEGQYIDFPLSPLNLAGALGLPVFVKAGLEVLRARLGGRGGAGADFESFALRTYGRTLAERFLLGYSEKLWGAPCRRLSPRIAGKRMQGLTLKTFVKEALLGRGAKTEHLDGSFFYPRRGIGMIPDALGAACGEEHIRRESAITGIRHDGKRIAAVEVNGGQEMDTGFVVSTLPLDRFLQMMTPRPPDDVLAVARGLRYRNVVLVALFLNRESVTHAATLYFPGPEFPFTRLYEPRNRSAAMSPPGRTSLVVEMLCQGDDPVWAMADSRLVERVLQPLFKTRMITEREVMDSAVTRMSHAYPVLEAGFEEKLDHVMTYLGQFKNLEFSGRSGRFAYTHLHDLMRSGRAIVDRAVAAGKVSAAAEA